MVDGLDEDFYPTHSPSVASSLPTLVEERAHVLVTSRPRPHLPDDMPEGHPRHGYSSGSRSVRGQPGSGEAAEKELRDLIRGPDPALALTVLGLLTAAAGPLSARDLADLTVDAGRPSAALRAQVMRLITEDAARSLEPVGSGEFVGYKFAMSPYSGTPNPTLPSTTPSIRIGYGTGPITGVPWAGRPRLGRARDAALPARRLPPNAGPRPRGSGVTCWRHRVGRGRDPRCGGRTRCRGLADGNKRRSCDHIGNRIGRSDARRRPWPGTEPFRFSRQRPARPRARHFHASGVGARREWPR